MKAHLEPLIWVLRVFSDGNNPGDPYVWCATLKKIDEETVEILGVLVGPSLAQIRAIKTAIKAAGFSRAIWRHNNKMHEAI